ncbi:MAG: lipopolysaccharide heptosyltransferase II [Pirellulales bacterium]|nr:lipopolysaccharide heptosyltransferase II [Pirellulales bacterium]
MNLAVFLPNWIGDVVMTTPVLRALRSHFANARIIGVMRPYVADVLAGSNWFDEQLFYHPKSDDPALRSRAMLRHLRKEKPDTAVLLPNSFRSGLLARLSGAKRRIGYVRYGRGFLLTDKIKPPRDPNGKLARTPMVDSYLRLATVAGCPPESPQLELHTTEADRQHADVVWKSLGLTSRVVVVNSSGAFGGAKLWPPKSFGVLARMIAATLDHDVLAICGPSERDAAREIVATAQHPRVVSLADEQLSLGLSKECVRRARLMVTTDSGPRHFAAAFGVPLVSLFGPTPPVWGDNPTVLETQLMLDDLDCLGCHERMCPLGHHRCMVDLRPESVFHAVATAMQQAGSSDRPNPQAA